MSNLKILVFVGSVRDNRLGSRVLTMMKSRLDATPHEITIFDAKEMNIELVKKPLHHYEDQSEAPVWLREAAQKVKDADAYLVVSPEYNSTIPPPLSNMMDHFPPANYSLKPSAICTYSPATWGGIRCSIALRPFLNELGTFPIPEMLNIPEVHGNVNEEGTPKTDRVAKGADKLVQSLIWFGEAIKNQRNAKGEPKL